MLIACWSVKGGSGATVVAAALALLLARSAPGGAALADLAGDAPAALGVPEPDGAGLAGWLAGGGELAPVDVGSGLRLLHRGSPAAPWTATDGERIATGLGGPEMVVVDCGSSGSPAGLAVAGVASLSLLVVRPCFLALRRAAAAPVRPSAIVLVDEPGRSLGRLDVEGALGAPVRAEVRWDPAVARAVDAGLLSARLPRTLGRALGPAACA